MRLKAQLLAVAAAYCGPPGRSETRVSTVLFGSGQRLRQLRSGTGMASDRIEDALQWFSDRWPDGVAWPEGVPRPTPAPAAEPEAPSER